MTIPRSTLLLLALLCSCASHKPPADPLSDLRNPSLSVPARQKAITRSWEMAQAGTLDRTAVREDLKTVAWSRHWDVSLRLAALSALLSDPDDKGREDTHGMARLMLPREPEPRVTEVLANAAAKNNWKDATPALVRSLSIPWIGIPDRDRPESQAIRRLNPGASLEGVVYKVFRDPPEDGGPFGLVPADKVRTDAWNVLNRLDPDGSVRAALIAEDTGGPASDLRAAMTDLKVMPGTGEELAWLSALRTNPAPEYRDWWAKTSSVVLSLQSPRAEHLRIRHLEPIRWASEHHPQWLAASADELYNELAQRLDGRKLHRRMARDPGEPKPVSEKLADSRSILTWADLLSLLVIDDALRNPGVPEALFAQAAMDKDDKTAEYGGLLRSDSAGAFSVVLYPPRPGSRRGDNEFVASSDMFTQSDHALAHYHLHAQDTHNATYSGPSRGDLTYAARHGRTCLVLTWVSTRALNADVYTPEGAVIDLGEIAAPTPAR